MRCVLLIPAWRPQELFPKRTALSQLNYWQPLGTLYVASSLQEAGHEVHFLNGAFLGHQELLAELRRLGPQVVGIYSTAFGWPQAVRTAQDIRVQLKDAFLLAGGPYPIAMKAQCLKEAPALDAVVSGEGEHTMVELLERLERGRTLEGLRGLIFRKRAGEIVENPPRALIQDLDSLPFPARELLHDKQAYLPAPATYRRRPVAVMLTSRGCNRRCIFCFQLGREIRFRSIANVIAEIEHCLREGYREIKFIDDTMAANYHRALELAQEIRLRGLRFSWFASACVNQVDARLLRAFKEAGCWAILMGAESGVQKNLNALRKGITVEQTRRAVKAAKEAGLRVFLPFIFGIPGETYQEALQSIQFAIELEPDVVNFHALTPFPGTELYERAHQWGRIARDLRDYTYQGAAFVPHTLKREEILQLRQLAFRRFYSRPRYWLRRLLALRSLGDLRAVVLGARSLLGLWVSKGLFRTVLKSATLR